MLQHLHIENIAVIERADIQFMPGFNVLTGETGAGKSIVIDSLCAILGARTSRDLIRHGQSKAVVSALFCGLAPGVLAKAADLGFACEDDSLLVSREIGQDGRNTCRVNGRPASVGVLKALGEALINIHGQNDGMALLSDDSHIDYLDAFGGYQEELQQYYREYRSLLALRRQIKEKAERNEELRRQADLLQFQHQELEAAGLTAGEYAALSEKRLLLANVEKTAANMAEAKTALYGDDEAPGVVGLLTIAEARLRECESWSGQLRDFSARARELLALSQELERDVDAFSNSIDFSPEELAQIEERLDVIGRLMKKYMRDEEGLLALERETAGQLAAIEAMDEDLSALNDQYAAKRDQVQALSQTIHQLRRQAAVRLTQRIEQELRQLDMPHARFQVKVESAGEQGHVKFTRKGTDSVAFLMTANPGETFKPLAKIASGGELSRIMLAMKRILGDLDYIPTLIFDEIDSGISGITASIVGKKLLQIAQNHQVLCITHLPQIASCGGHHYKIQKSEQEESTVSTVVPLDEDERVDEIARLLGGINITETTLKSARELLSLSGAQAGV